ncbi:MAG: substrate-binding domain-containing protein, partial [Verrucomicrobiota bacterium]
MNPARRILLGSLLLLALLVGLLRQDPRRPGPVAASPGAAAVRPLLVYCAAGLKGPVEAVARDYERRFGVPVQLQFGGSGTLLSNLRVARQGDLFLAADGSYVDLARSHGIAAEVLPLARLTPVIVTRRDRSPPLQGWEDLERPGVTLALANPDAAAVGRQTRRVLERLGRWASLESHVKVYKPTVNDLANDVKLGTVDAAIVWDATAAQYPELVAFRAPGLETASSTVSAVVLGCSTQPTAALRFARFLGARDAGLRSFAAAGFPVVRGDVWADPPEVLLYSGAVNRLAIEESLREFEDREGVRVTRVYNGCGILTAQIRAGQRPDAYFACDVSFMTTVAGEFAAPVPLAETRMVLLTRPGNP